ncbi:hypothetical protein Lal_00019035 [Lupinus albus]|nr:hypothetical protein Lal_00019035 [Lupinus albus]
MVAPFSFKHTGMHSLAQSESVSAFSTKAIAITKQIRNAARVFFEAIVVENLLLYGFVEFNEYAILYVVEIHSRPLII